MDRSEVNKSIFSHLYGIAILFLCFFLQQSAFSYSPEISGNGNDGLVPWLSPLDPMSPRYAVHDNLNYNGYLVVQGKKVPLKGNVAQLHYFFDALGSVRSRKVRIAHWGDSIILGDIISEGLRDNLQKQFGGNGVGFVSMNCDDQGMRNTTLVSFSNDWREASLFKRNADKWPLGINGSVYSPVHGSWVKYETGKASKSMRFFSGVRLFYASAPVGAVLKYSLSNGSEMSARLESGPALNELSLNLPSGITSIKFSFNFSGGYFYGVSFENGNGVYVDNLPIRGNTGVALADLPLGLLKEFNAKLNYKLIIINFGVNIVSPEHSTYVWYEQRMGKVISYLKEAFPQASILVISIGDKAIKKGTRYITDPGIPALLKTQQTIAEKNGTAFWNLFETMGGENSIVNWEEANPQLSEKDYCHLTPAGGKLVADLLFEALLKEKR